MRTVSAALAGLMALAAVSAEAAPLPPAKADPNLPARLSNWSAKDVDMDGIAGAGGTVGVTGIGVASTRIGSFSTRSRLCIPLGR
jgi:hypothetical protein